jgi:chromosomal replication initiation ATPase DnaA
MKEKLLWKSLISKLKQNRELNGVHYWLEEAELITENDHDWKIVVANPVMADWINDYYIPLIKTEAEKMLKTSVFIKVTSL